MNLNIFNPQSNNEEKYVGTRTRVITSVVALPILILPIYFGGYALYILMFLLTFVGQYELLRGLKINDRPIVASTFIMTAVYYYMIYNGLRGYMMAVITAYIIILLLYFVLMYPKYDFKKITQSIIAFFYVNLMLSYVLLIRISEPYGRWFVWLVFLISFGSDTFAYFSGRKFGKHKLAKELSPKKTIEGAIGGMLGSILLCVLYGIMLVKVGAVDDLSNISHLIVLGGIGSVLSIVGDLVASAIKRQNNIKDFGAILPGHGGIMDRFDSNILTAPFVYYIMVIYFLH